ncbi:MAG: hypothetical protein OXF44_01420 [Anaerolineaceae bacterium]|nr:hypothetical protein [Anaerolineaceae bacterium]
MLALLALMLSSSASAISRILISVPADFATIGAALEHASDHAITFAGFVLASLPLIIIFGFTSRRFMDGLAGGLSI